MNEQAPDFIRNLGNKTPEQIVNTTPSEVPDFIVNLNTQNSNINFENNTGNHNTINQSMLNDIKTKNELGVDFDNSFSKNPEQVKQYVDNLSNEDYQIWTNLKNEGYSLDARKAMFDNKDDLYDITAPGNEKFYSGNKSKILDTLINMGQNFEDAVGNIYHPWNQSVQEKLGGIEQILNETKFSDIKNLLAPDENTNRFIRSYRDMGASFIAGYVRKEEIAGSLISGLIRNVSDWVEQGLNLGSKKYAEGINSVVDMFDEKYGYNKITPNENLPSKRGSLTRMLADSVGIAWTIEQPLASFIMTGLVNEDEKLQELMSKGFKHLKDYVDPVFDWLAEQGIIFDKMTEEERDITILNVLYGIFGLTGKGIVGGVGKMSNSKIAREFQAAYNIAKKRSEFAKIQTENELAQGIKGAMKDLPEGAQFTTKGGTPLFTNTTSGIKPTWQGNIWANTKIRGAQWETFKNYLQWIYKNKDKWLVTRNPKEPVGDLPVTPGVRPEGPEPKLEEQSTGLREVRNEIKPEEIKTEGIKTTTPKTELKPTIETPKEETSTIGTFLKKIKDDISEISKTGSKKEIMDKLQTSKELQSEYINTIDPYLKANGGKNPNGVIEQPLRDFINTVKEQLEFMRNSEKDSMINSMKTKVNIPKMDQILNKANQKQYKELIKVLSQEVDQPEELLKYLLNLPKETTKTLDRIIPDYSKNLQLIKDTLDLTKAITSTDLLGKFLNYKSTIGTKDRNFLRKYLYKKLAETYNEQGVKRKMRDIETMLNTMSEEELVQLDKDIDAGNLRKFDESVDWRSQGYMKETFGEKGNRSLEQIMNSKRPGTNKTIREYLKEKGVKITAVDDNTQYRQLTHEMMGHESLAAYSENLDRLILKRFENPYFGFIFHEFGHRLFNQLGTSQMLDMLDYISKRDNISQEAAFERRAEYFRNYMQYNNIDGKRYILKELGEAFDPKLLQVMEKTKQEVFDLFNISGKDLEINQIMSDVKHDTKTGKEITSRKPQPLLSKRLGENLDERSNWLKKIDPEVDSIVSDSTKGYTSIYDQGNVYIKMKNGDLETWNQFKNKLSEEQLAEVDTYEEQVLDDLIGDIFGIETEEGFKGEGKFNYDTLENQTPIRELLKDSFNVTKEDLGLDFMQTVTLLDSLKEIDPDIVGLGEKDGQLSVKYIIEGYSERRELPDRPGQLEVKEVPAYDYFTEEEKAKLPKEIQDRIGNPGENIDNEGNILSKQQEEYFKDSEVRNNKGELIVVYHGSRNSNFDEFDPSYIGNSNGNDGFFGAGMYFTDDKSVAADYMRSGRSNDKSIPGIKAGYLNIKKMFDFDKTYSKEEYNNLLNELGVTKYELPANEYQEGKFRLMNGYDLEFFTNQEMDMDEFHRIFGDDIKPDEILQGRDLTRVLQKAGYDGAYGDSGTTREWVIFNSNQFKPLSNKVPYDTGKFSDKELVTKVLDEIKK